VDEFTGSTRDTRGVSRRTLRNAQRSRASARDGGIAVRRDRHDPAHRVLDASHSGPFLFGEARCVDEFTGSTRDTRGVSRRTSRNARRSRASARDDGTAVRRDRHNPVLSAEQALQGQVGRVLTSDDLCHDPWG